MLSPIFEDSRMGVEDLSHDKIEKNPDTQCNDL